MKRCMSEREGERERDKRFEHLHSSSAGEIYPSPGGEAMSASTMDAVRHIHCTRSLDCALQLVAALM